ncbi:hypothetical protein [Bosea sp. RAC05]|uniref:hypothetical protein n=1 Tax=Bosea sp. RAC05 TaxID=1842539 RepID=UPI00083CDEB1|nr:hypothetical protein [Bosea sp. RAC05]AOG03368.1 hypothetical protein BSY19_5175 [Bosea sp. RAC05]
MMPHPLFGQQIQSPLARPFKRFELGTDEALIPFDDHWQAFAGLLPSQAELAVASDQALVDCFRLPPALFSTIIPQALSAWRQSPSRSLVNLTASLAIRNFQGPIFSDLALQSRVIGSALSAGAVLPADVRSVYAPDRSPIKVSTYEIAVSLTPAAWEAFNDLARGFRLWELRNRARVVHAGLKPPKLFYRGIRDRDIDAGPLDLRDDEPWAFRASKAHLMRRDHLLSRPLVEVMHSPILSFTANAAIAEYFANDEGMVFDLPPQDVEIISGWGLDPCLGDRDQVSGRHEREWIVRIPEGYRLGAHQVRSRCRDFAYASRDPAGIAMLHHETRARYSLGGRRVEAQFCYNSSGRGGRIYFIVDDGRMETRATMKARTGFDPLPAPGAEISDLVFFTQDRFSRRKKTIPIFSEAEWRLAHELDAGSPAP